mmetsp:Transcript_31047/g.78434  ORF Transcript_31047/g.78434 Transcript_31047/m.78434 type:complete len:228 (+) Transcript_31047:345-1028(+)
MLRRFLSWRGGWARSAPLSWRPSCISTCPSSTWSTASSAASSAPATTTPTAATPASATPCTCATATARTTSCSRTWAAATRCLTRRRSRACTTCRGWWRRASGSSASSWWTRVRRRSWRCCRATPPCFGGSGRRTACGSGCRACRTPTATRTASPPAAWACTRSGTASSSRRLPSSAAKRRSVDRRAPPVIAIQLGTSIDRLSTGGLAAAPQRKPVLAGEEQRVGKV